MKINLILFLVVGLIVIFSLLKAQANTIIKPQASNVYEFTVKTIDGQEKSLNDYKGKVLLIVNTASHCGFTSQYKGLEAVYQQFKAQGFEVLAFPANNFMGQEPGTNSEIKNFCTLKFKTTFPLFDKISVKGADTALLYQYLTTQKGFSGNITWNFNKFLIDQQGKISARFDSSVEPESEAIVSQIKKLLSS
ncbi:MAG: glutathione peroxidase [Candidatus Omnitrophota bacterium]